MKIYKDIDVLQRHLIKEIKEKGKIRIVRGLKTKELIDTCFCYNFDALDFVCTKEYMISNCKYIKEKFKENSKSFDYMMNQLIKDLSTRRAVMDFFDYKLKEPYCYITAQFIIRDKKLRVLVFWRSLDVETKLSQDLEFFSYLADEVCHVLGVELNYIKANVGSLHVYLK